MKFLQVLAALFLILVAATPAWAGRCSGGAFCTACSNCSRCGHCSTGGTCSVCRPDLYQSTSSSSSSSSSRTYTEPPKRDSYEPPRVYEYSTPSPPLSAREFHQNTDRPGAGRRGGREQVVVTRTLPPRPPQTAKNPTIIGRCVAVTDGDTIKVLAGQREIKIRLQGIDAPETGQPFGTQSKKLASDIAFGKTTTVYPTGTDRYGRTLGWVFVGKTSLNSELVKNGLAWWYREYSPNETKLRDLETQARTRKIGLWSDPHAVAPWDWRHGTRTASVVTASAPPVAPISTTETESDARSQSLMEGPLWWVVFAGLIGLIAVVSLKFGGKRR